MMSLFGSPSQPAASAGLTPEQVAVDLGVYARKIFEDYKNSEIDAFALRLAEEKAQKARSKASGSVQAVGGGSGKGGGGRGNKSTLLGFNSREARLGPRDPFRIPKLPRNPGDQIVWAFQKTNSTTITTSTSAITETNISVSLSSLAQNANWTALFDQYLCHWFSVSIEWNLAPGSTTAGQVYMVADYDNLTNLGSIQAIENYRDCKVFNIRPGSVTSLCVSPCAGSSVGSQTLSGLSRQWLDCAYPNITHYGIRTMLPATTVSFTGVPVVTMCFCFRSGI